MQLQEADSESSLQGHWDSQPVFRSHSFMYLFSHSWAISQVLGILQGTRLSPAMSGLPLHFLLGYSPCAVWLPAWVLLLFRGSTVYLPGSFSLPQLSA